MPDIRLQEYVAKIKDMIREDRHGEAIAHCQHILSLYPKHIETYSLLGEACLEKEAYREAIEFFQRTLSADPENFIARVGLGIICDEQGALPEAIWHMERAFELAPGNAEVRRELQRLYTQRDGKEKARLKLTRGALGRLYARNGLFERAIGEFRAVLRQEPDLPDIRVGLVEALWREGRRLDAVESCLELLEALPNCLKANLILAEIWMRGGHEDASEEKLARANALDPENRVAQEMMGRDSPLPPKEVMIAELEAFAQVPSLVPAETADVATAAAWGVAAGELAAEEEPTTLEAAEEWGMEEPLPDWLQDMGMTELEESAPGLEFGQEDEEVAPGEELPDWLKELTGEEEIPTAEGFAASVIEEGPADEALPNWLQDLEASAEVGVTLPDEGLKTEEEIFPAEAPETAETLETAEDIPDWLQKLEAPIEVAVPAEDELPTEETPDWLRELEPTAGEQVTTLPAEEVPVEEVPDWLRELEEPAAELVSEAPVEAPAVEEKVAEVPDWLRELEEPTAETITEEPIEAPIIEEAAPIEKIPEPTEETHPVVEAEAPAATIPASLLALVSAGILDEADLESAMAEMSPEELDEQRAEEVPIWLQDLVEEEPAQPEGEPIPHPIESIHVETEPEVEEITTEEAKAPDWLGEIEEPEATEIAEQPVAEETVPVEVEARPQEPVIKMPVVTLEEETIPPTAEVPESMWALVEAGILDEADLEQAMAEMSAEELEAQQAEEIPEWLQELAVEEEPAPVEKAAPPQAEAPTEEIPDWLRELEAPDVEAPPMPEEPSAVIAPSLDEVPESLRALVEAGILDEADLESAMAEMSPEELAAQQAEEIPAWLQQMMGEEPALAEAEETLSQPAVEVTPKEMPIAKGVESAEEMPDWLHELQAPSEETAPEPVTEAPVVETEPPGEEFPSWMQELEIEPPTPSAEEAVAAQEAEMLAEAPESLRALVEAGILDEADLESAMAEMSPEELAEQQAEEIPSWLQEMMGEEVAQVEEKVVQPPAVETPVEEGIVQVKDEAPAEEIPDWLRDLDELEAEEPVEPPLVEAIEEKVAPIHKETPTEEIPGWLRDVGEPAAEAVVEPLAAEEITEPSFVETPVLEEPEPDITAPPLEIQEKVRPIEEPFVPITEAPPTKEVPESLQALVTAGILDEADIESVMAEMSPEELEKQRAEKIPNWLRELMDEEISTPPIDQMPSAEEEIPTEEIPDWLRELEAPEVEDLVPTLSTEAAPTRRPIADAEIAPEPFGERTVEEAPIAEVSTHPPVAKALEPETPMVEELPEPILEAAEVEEFAPPTTAEMVAPYDRVEVEEVIEKSRVDELQAQLEARPKDYKTRLELAKAYQEERKWDAALAQYEKLISARKFLSTVIEELQALPEDEADQARLYQMLGDAHMQEDHLEEALVMYRRARKALLKH